MNQWIFNESKLQADPPTASGNFTLSGFQRKQVLERKQDTEKEAP